MTLSLTEGGGAKRAVTNCMPGVTVGCPQRKETGKGRGEVLRGKNKTQNKGSVLLGRQRS